METALSAKKKFSTLDAAAIAVCIGLFTCLCYSATRGVGSIDESFYYTIVQRQLMGDRLLIDEWHVSQLSSVLQILPYWFFKTVTGSTEGVILYLRFLFLIVHLAIYWFLYFCLRKYGWWGLVSVFLFCAYIPNQIMTLNYYMITLHGSIVVCALLFLGKEKKSIPVLLLTGAVIACTVLAEPFAAALYFIWCLLLLCRVIAQKRNKEFLSDFGFVLDKRVWFFTTAGIVAVAMIFFTYLLIRSPLPEIVKSVPELFTDYEYSFNQEGKSLLDTHKIRMLLRFYGYVPPVAGIVLLVVSMILKKKGALYKRSLKRLLLFCACLCLVCAYLAAAVLVLQQQDIRILRHDELPDIFYYYYYQQAPLLLFGLICYVLCEHKDHRMFCFWFVGLFISFAVDISSDVIIGFGGAIVLVEAMIVFGTLLKELHADTAACAADGGDNAGAGCVQSRFLAGIAAFTVFAAVIWESIGLYTGGFYHIVENVCNIYEDQDLTVQMVRGPLKGIRTTARVGGIYEDILSDLDEIKANTPGPIYVTQLFSYTYLYLEQPIGTYSTWYVEEDSEVRQCRYWELHPEKRPSSVYIPYYDAYSYLSYKVNRKTDQWGEDKIRFLQTLCSCEVTEGKAGFILRVIRWYD